MQIEQTILNGTAHKISGHLHKLFDQAPHAPAEPALLNQQPISQRQLFMKQAVADGRQVFAQLLPVNSAGYRVNIHATIKALSQGRFLFQTKNLTYVVRLPQINYIASL